MTDTKIEWRKIEGFENYSVSSAGKVRNDETSKVLKGKKNTAGYLQVGIFQNGKRKYLLVHRLVALHFIPNPNYKICVDHTDGDPSNNKIENLRWATKRENGANSRMQINNTSGVTGVCWNKHVSKWQVRIHINGKNASLGYFSTIEEATEARRKAAQEHYGEFCHPSERIL